MSRPGRHPGHPLNGRPSPYRSLATGGAWLLATAATAVCVYRAIALAWLADDSFISFRYAENLVRGHGLVYNVGERVEGYTNLLWTLLIAATMALGISPEATAKVAGIVFWLSLVAVLGLWSRQRGDGRPFMPLAACLVLVMPDYQTWATGGLETSMFAFLSVAGVLLACRLDAGSVQMLLAGLLLAMAVATRPDGVIFAAVGVAGGWLVRAELPIRTRLARSAALILPLVLAGTALVVFKLSYYGDLFPTAFYSKSALNPYYGQGLVYVCLFFLKNWILLPLALIIIVLLFLNRGRQAVAVGRTDLIFLAAFLGFAAYVVHSGGDFMFARRLLPAMPFLFLALEDLLRSVSGVRVQVAILAVAVVGAWLPYPLYPDRPYLIRGIADERMFYTPEILDLRRAQARAAARALAAAPVRAIYEGSMCMFGYYSGLPYLAESTGLTQYTLAKQPLAARGRVGHEKSPDAEWATANHIHFIFLSHAPPFSLSEPRNADEIFFEGTLMARIWIYNDAIMDRLRDNPAVDFVPIERTLAVARQKIDQAPYEEAKGMYEFLERFYFRAAGPEKQRLADEFIRQVEARKPSAPNR